MVYGEPGEEQSKEEEQEAQPAEETPTAETPAEAPAEEAPLPKPARRVVRIRKPPPTKKSTVAAIPEIDDKFWASLLNTQRTAEKATRLQRISEFQLM